MRYFLLEGLKGFSYVVGEDLSVTRNDGREVTLSRVGRCIWFQQVYISGEERSYKYFSLLLQMATEFLPNPENFKYVSFINPNGKLELSNLMWVKSGRRRRTNEEIKKEEDKAEARRLRREAASRLKIKKEAAKLEKEAAKLEKASKNEELKEFKVKKVVITEEIIPEVKNEIIPIKPLDKFFLKKENCPFTKHEKKLVPKLDSNFKPIITLAKCGVKE